MLKVVLDTDVIVAALRSKSGGSNALLREIAYKRIIPLVTVALLLEYEAVLKRPEQRLAHGLGLDAIDRFLAALASTCQGVEVSFRRRPQLARKVKYGGSNELRFVGLDCISPGKCQR